MKRCTTRGYYGQKKKIECSQERFTDQLGSSTTESLNQNVKPLSGACRAIAFCLLNLLLVFTNVIITAMFFNENKRKRLHNNRVKFPEDLLGAPTWLPFLWLGAPTWPPWSSRSRHRHSCLRFLLLVKPETGCSLTGRLANAKFASV